MYGFQYKGQRYYAWQCCSPSGTRPPDKKIFPYFYPPLFSRPFFSFFHLLSLNFPLFSFLSETKNRFLFPRLPVARHIWSSRQTNNIGIGFTARKNRSSFFSVIVLFPCSRVFLSTQAIYCINIDSCPTTESHLFV